MTSPTRKEQSVVILEDSKTMVEVLIRELHRRWPDVHVEVVRSESEFIASIPRWEADPPTAYILDQMVRWGIYSETDKIPAEAAKNGYHQAGIRCAARLVQHRIIDPKAIAMHSVAEAPNDTDDLPKGCTVIRKSRNAGRALVAFLEDLFDTP